jgi:hypothetical protein
VPVVDGGGYVSPSGISSSFGHEVLLFPLDGLEVLLEMATLEDMSQCLTSPA